MAETEVITIEPDVKFVRELMANGGETLKKCFQCGNCSVVCNISPDNEPFPRKEMIWAQWGIKEKLTGNVDVWLCHQCNDCSAHCPRGANPGDVMAAVRNVSFSHYAPFGLGKLLLTPKYLPILFALPAILIGIVIAIASKEGFLSAKPIVFSNMMPVPAIDVVFLPAVAFATFCAIIGITKAWKSFSAHTPGRKPEGSLVGATIEVVLGILLHKNMFKCEVNGPRTKGHLLTFYGFLALVATTTAVAIMYWINKLGISEVAHTPLPLDHPVKILGNVGALVAFTGIFIIAKRRLTGDPKEVGSIGYYDRFFGGVLFWTINSGILSEIFRLADIAILAFGVYYVHLILVFMLLAYAPFSKFAHMFYRFTALVWAKSARREGGVSAASGDA